jgi:phosphotransferase system HPr-like phosphotransfer protein
MEDEKKPDFLYEKPCKVIEPIGLCPWPCYNIVLEVAQSVGTAGLHKIFIRRVDKDQKADPFSILSLMMLGACNGTELVVFTHDQTLVGKVDSLAEFIGVLKNETIVNFTYDDFSKMMKEYVAQRDSKD